MSALLTSYHCYVQHPWHAIGMSALLTPCSCSAIVHDVTPSASALVKSRRCSLSNLDVTSLKLNDYLDESIATFERLPGHVDVEVKSKISDFH
ncbi:hypothetical protein Bpfe_024065 [Biomphalaria pfeifferi]|uniref:Uncharacterized protein n=1 Tax=Biomphalaria pfeifferi TaxID=112525 RepID=A0AAD8EZT3_BIOPF|nr:hypothetical protein Bpfe_024065 [Biomphalaria pfeifferi]